MASQRQFEGPVLEELLARVRAEVGPDARIVAANRVRKGGVGGFFARQAFEVVVEPGESATGTAQAQPAVEQASPQQATPIVATEPAATPTAAPVSIPTAAPIRASVATANGRTETRAPATILELADAVSDDERNNVIDLVEERSVSTESHDFAQVLDRFSKALDATPEELDEINAGSDIDLRDSEDDDASEDDGAADGYSSAAYVDMVPLTPRPIPLPDEPSEPPRRPADEIRVDEPDNMDATAPAFVAGTDVVSLVPTPATRSQRRAAPTAQVIDRYETRLSRLGLPARLIPRGAAQHELKGALVESLTRLPPAPGVPVGLGVVIAVVGEGSAPVPLARDLASELGLDPDDVVLATREHLGFGIPAWLQMNDSGTAEERRRSWRRRSRPTIVACSLPPEPRGLRWAREILDNLEPTITWAIVDAGAKREDMAHRVDALGGVDVLAMDRLDDTVSPAAVLELGLPVGRLAEEHASPLTWTELLMERMSS